MVSKYKSIPIETLRQTLEYNSETGKVYWKERPSSMLSSPEVCRAWNDIYAGKEAFCSVLNEGYLRGCVLGTSLQTHRVVWALYYGYWPDIIDHINGDLTDNRIANLRSVSVRENQQNQAHHRSGRLCGTTRSKCGKKWTAGTHVDGKYVHLGTHETETAAHEAYLVKIRALSSNQGDGNAGG